MSEKNVTVQSLTKRLNVLKQAAENDKSNLAKLQGKREQLLSQLKEKFDLDTLEEAEETLQSLKKNVKKREERAETKLTELEELINGEVS